MPTFIFNNRSKGSSYVVLDPEFNTNPVLSTVPKYFSTISFPNLTNISEDNIVVNDYKLGIVVPEGDSSFEFTPSISVPIPKVIIRGAGDCSVTYVDGATTINVSPSELNRRGEESSLFTNPDCFEFDGVIGNQSLSTTQDISNRVYNFNNAISISCWVTFGDDMFTNTGNKNFIIVDQAGPSSNTKFSKGYCLYVTRAPNNAKLLRFQVGTINTPTPPPTPSNQRAQINITSLRTSSSQVFFILATYDSSGGGNIRLYLRSAGISQENSQVPDFGGQLEYTNQTNRFCIGNTEPNGNQGFDGKIDEVGIFEKALDGGDADNLFNWNANGNLLSYNNTYNSELRGWYRMGENANFSNPGGAGDWTLRSATDLADANLELESSGIAEGDKISPGLVGPA